jgi:hypothetical protein
MTTRRNPENGSPPRVSESPIEDEGVRQQLAELFGKSLFGPWPQLQHDAGKWRQGGRSRRWLWKLSILVTLVAAAFGLHSLVQPGLKHQVDDQRGRCAQELKTFLNDGNLERASQYVPLVEGHAGGEQKRDIDPKDAHLDLIVATEAALYRYYDGSPERLRRILPYLDNSGQASALRKIANLTVLSREERAAKLESLEGLRNDLPDNNELEYLLATALEYKHDAQSSRRAWERSAKLEPAWLGHRFEHAWFELHQDRAPAAQQIASQMLRVDPDSPWSKLAAGAFLLPKNIAVTSIRGDAAAPVATPVEIYVEMLVQGILAASRNDFSRAKERLADAFAAIYYQAPFLFDAFDWCVDENEPALARELSNMPQWPRNSKVAIAKLERLSNLQPIQRKEPASAPVRTLGALAQPPEHASTKSPSSPKPGKGPAHQQPTK